MSTKMTERDWELALEVFRACLPRRGAKGRDGRLFPEALHFAMESAGPRRHLAGAARAVRPWNSVWKRFSRLSQAGVFEAFFAMFAECSRTARRMKRRMISP